MTHVSPAVPDEERRRLGFGTVAELYDLARPGYPDALINDVIGYSEIAPGERALDVGAGTGQATLQFAARGLDILAIEPSAEMVEVAAQRFAQAGFQVDVRASDLESLKFSPHEFSLVYAATSWHWVDENVRWRIAGQALAPGGTLAVFWNWPRWRSSDLVAELDEVYEASGADTSAMGPMYEFEPSTVDLSKQWVAEATASGEFFAPQARIYPWEVIYSASEYVALLGTYSDHIVLEADVRSRLFDGVARVIEAAGGTVSLPYVSLLLLARTA